MKKSFFLLPLVLCAAQQNAFSAVVIDNLATGTLSRSTKVTGPSAVDIFLPGAPPIPSPHYFMTFGFVTGPAGGDLTNLEARVGSTNSTSPIDLTLSTGSSVSGGLNSITIASTTVPSNNTAINTSFTPAAPVTLAPNTLYWLTFTSTNQGNYYVENTNTPTLAQGWSINGTYTRQDTSPWFQVDQGREAQLSLTIADAVPEPSSMLLTALGLGTCLMKRLRS